MTQKGYFIQFTQFIKISPNSLTLYTPRSTHTDDSRNFYHKSVIIGNNIDEGPRSTHSNSTNGYISLKAQSRLQNKIKYLFWLSKCFMIQRNKLVCIPNNKISFVTLTLCAEQWHSDGYIKKNMINQFCVELSNRYEGLLYIWRAEKQSNGNIHFHFMINKFIRWQIIRKLWNRILKKEGYLSRYQAKFSGMWFEEYCTNISNFRSDKIPQYKKAYLAGVACGWSDPNSIDVVNIKGVKNIYSYISKYMCKNSNNGTNISEDQHELLKVEGRIYYCCAAINSIRSDSLPIDAHITMDLDKIKLARPDCVHHYTYFSCIRLSIEEIFNIGAFHIYNLFIIHTNNLFLCQTKDLLKTSAITSKVKSMPVTRQPLRTQLTLPLWNIWTGRLTF